jgi:hypothetical protein
MRLISLFIVALLAFLCYCAVDAHPQILYGAPALQTGLKFIDGSIRPIALSLVNYGANCIISWIHNATATPVNIS